MNRIIHVDKKEINHLVKEIGIGNEFAFEVLYNKMKKIIYYFLLGQNANKDAIEDVIASTFLIVIEKSKNKMIYKNCFSWILTIAKFQLMNYNKKHDKVTFDDERIDKFGTISDLNSLSFKQEVEKLDKESQLILYFIFYEKLTYAEVSKILHISVSTIKRRRNDILKHFKEFYYNEED